MGFWIFMLVVCLLVPGIMLCAGYLMAKHPPKNINFMIGYRTTGSMKNQDTWNFAHSVAGKFWMKWGAITLLPSTVLMAVQYGQTEESVGFVGLGLMILQMIPLLAVIPVTERALRGAFDQDGRKRA